MIKQSKYRFSFYAILALFTVAFATNAHAAAKVSIEDDSFGVVYENPGNTNKGLILFISNSKCVGSYRIANNELVIASGDINARGPSKLVILGTAKFNIDCGPMQSLVLMRQ